MKKILYVIKELSALVSQHKLYFLAPLFCLLAVLALLFFKLGPGLMITFIYAGI